MPTNVREVFSSPHPSPNLGTARSGLPCQDAADRCAECGFEDGGFTMGEGDGDFAERFVGGDLA